MIRAILQDGQIRPVEPLPAEWADGRELTVDAAAAESFEPLPDDPTQAELDAWYADVQRGVAAIPQSEHDAFLRAIAEVEAESKRSVRREWGLE